MSKIEYNLALVSKLLNAELVAHGSKRRIMDALRTELRACIDGTESGELEAKSNAVAFARMLNPIAIWLAPDRIILGAPEGGCGWERVCDTAWDVDVLGPLLLVVLFRGAEPVEVWDGMFEAKSTIVGGMLISSNGLSGQEAQKG